MPINEVVQFDETNSGNVDIGGIVLSDSTPIDSLDNIARAQMGAIARFTGGDTVASAATTDLGALPGQYVEITGTTTITGLGTIRAGIIKFVRFAGALTLTYNATSLILPSAANIVTAAGDTAVFVSEGSGNWRCIDYSRASGAALVVVSQAWEQIGTQTLSAASAATFTGLSAYRTLRATLFLTVSVDNEIIYAQTSVAGVFATVASGYNNQAVNGFGATVNTANTDGMKITSSLGNAGNEAASAVAHFFELNQARALYYISDTYCLNPSATAVKTQYGGLRVDSSARDGIRFLAGSGTITGFITLEGVRG